MSEVNVGQVYRFSCKLEDRIFAEVESYDGHKMAVLRVHIPSDSLKIAIMLGSITLIAQPNQIKPMFRSEEIVWVKK